MRVLALWRYPVKSMQGERLDEVAVGELGLAGDRSHAIVDLTTGLVLTARRDPSLLLATSRLRPDGEAEVTLPDGRIAQDDADLSEWLGRPVRLVRAASVRAPTYESDRAWEDDGGAWERWQGPSGAFHDSASARVSLVGCGTVGAMGNWDLRRFRANVVVDGQEEDDLLGRRVRLGGAVADVVEDVPRCVMVTRPQPGGIERDLDVLRTILRERAGNLAVGAVVVEPGTLRVGDEIEVLA